MRAGHGIARPSKPAACEETFKKAPPAKAQGGEQVAPAL
jgi:hypothetical protein